ncbi:MAG: Hsp33 family molecular chaperone HslO [Pseudomonadota bacterium]
MSENSDQLTRFLIESANIRGVIVSLDRSWAELAETRTYEGNMRAILGQAMVATTLMSANLKQSGRVTLQVSGSGPISLMVMQVNESGSVRGMAKAYGKPESETLSELFGQAQMSVIVEPDNGPERYQAIVEMNADTLSSALSNYFHQSEQLLTRIWLVANQNRVAGLMIQKLPDDTSSLDESGEAWQRIKLLAETLNEEELVTLDAQTLLHRLFHEEQVRMFEPKSIVFECTCSRERTANMISSLGEDEARSIIHDEGVISVECDFCATKYEFDAIDVEQLFGDSSVLPPSSTHH